MEKEKYCNPLKRPQMYGMLARNTKPMLIRVILVSALTGLVFKYGYIERKRAAYRNFYENYDIDKEFKRMVEKNVFDSC